MNKGYLYVTAFLVGALVMFFYMRGCASPPLHSLQDSLRLEKQLNDTIVIRSKALIAKYEWDAARDSIDRLAYQRIIDSQKRVINSLQGRFKSSKDSIFTLYGQLKTYYEAHDTLALFTSYRELRDELTIANNLLFSIQIQRDSLENASTSEIERLKGLITQLKGQINTLNDLLIQCTDNASSLAKNGNAAIKKARAANIWGRISTVLAAILGVILLVAK